jgi:hypothetical protein
MQPTQSRLLTATVKPLCWLELELEGDQPQAQAQAQTEPALTLAPQAEPPPRCADKH